MFFFFLFFLAIFVGYKCCACVSQKLFSRVFGGSLKLLRQTDLERTAATEAGWRESCSIMHTAPVPLLVSTHLLRHSLFIMMPIAVQASDQFVTLSHTHTHKAKTLLDTSTNYMEPQFPKKPNHESNTTEIIATLFVLPLPNSSSTTTTNT
jgi:hypothetical protein